MRGVAVFCHVLILSMSIPVHSCFSCLRLPPDHSWQMLPIGTACGSVTNTDSARRALVEATRPDLMRPISIVIGVLEGKNLVAKDKGGTSDPYCKVEVSGRGERQKLVGFQNFSSMVAHPGLQQQGHEDQAHRQDPEPQVVRLTGPSATIVRCRHKKTPLPPRLPQERARSLEVQGPHCRVPAPSHHLPRCLRLRPFQLQRPHGPRALVAEGGMVFRIGKESGVVSTS